MTENQGWDEFKNCKHSYSLREGKENESEGERTTLANFHALSDLCVGIRGQPSHLIKATPTKYVI